MRYDNANWENIRTDLSDTMRTIKAKYISCKVNELWNTFKVDVIKSIETNIPHKMITYKHTVPHKMITYKHRLPWVTNNLRKLINKKNKAYNKRKTNPTKYKTLEHQVQKELRKAYHDYIENLYVTFQSGNQANTYILYHQMLNLKNYLVLSKALEQTTLV